MIDVASHVRIFEADPSDDFVTKRIAAVKSLADKLDKERSLDTLLGYSDGIAKACLKGGELPEELAAVVEKAIRDESTAFVRSENELQMIAIALMSLGQVIATSKPSKNLSCADVLANGAWLALGFQPASLNPKLEALRAEVCEKARIWCLSSGSEARVRNQIPDAKMEAPDDGASNLTSKVNAAIEAPVTALRENAILDREEIDFLWWALGDYSQHIGAQLSQISAPVAAVAASLEAATILRRLPSEGHKHIVLRHVRPHDSLSLTELRAAIDESKAAFSPATSSQLVAKFPRVFAAITALAHDQTSYDPGKKSLEEWSGRIFAEAGLVHICALVPGAKL